MLPLQTLRAFRQAAQTQNLRAAAEQLNLTHGAVSQQIRLLEDRLGVSLFDRVGRGVRLNAAGAALLARVQQALALLEAGEREARVQGQVPQRVLRVSMLPSFAQCWLLPRLSRWQRAHPGWRLAIDARQTVVDVLGPGVDVAIRYGQQPWAGAVAKSLGQERLFPVASPSQADALRGLAAADLLRFPMLAGTAGWELWLQPAGVVEPPPEPVASFNDAGLLLQAAEVGMGIALARGVLVLDRLREGRLLPLHPLTVPAPRSYWLVASEPSWQRPEVQALHAWLLAQLAESERELATLM
ncbi:LysR family glycine cleavage system transcriptional activator [Inhella inkyongensis]|uniref:LysR family glycine cleavage system transcriptional activator n=1 Tax=Inhella inkyongensis TaxID=392593 RepID=A0A840S912_9BURK|nr:LysR substrate-binding domain-containing protein [Inhella inkyongensis]MBB5204910.1 LysR family glycine cleavage system transcriptional activator [Inhella inkyongensis]